MCLWVCLLYSCLYMGCSFVMLRFIGFGINKRFLIHFRLGFTSFSNIIYQRITENIYFLLYIFFDIIIIFFKFISSVGLEFYFHIWTVYHIGYTPELRCILDMLKIRGEVAHCSAVYLFVLQHLRCLYMWAFSLGLLRWYVRLWVIWSFFKRFRFTLFI